MDHLLQEVDADLRAERLHRLWLRYRRPFFLAIVAIVAMTAIHSMYRHYREQRGGEVLMRFVRAQALFDDGKPEEAATRFASLANDTRGDTRTLAELWQGRALAKADDTAGAVAAFTSASKGPVGLWSDLACLRLASLDTAAAEPCLANKKDSPLLNQRREWQAAGQWALGNREAAIDQFEELATSTETPEPARARINQWLSTLRAQSTPAKPSE